MAISKVVYGTKILVDLTSDTVDAEHLAAGYTAHDSAGNLIVGTLGKQDKKNLLRGTTNAISNFSYFGINYSTTEPLKVGKTYTISMYVEKVERSPLNGTKHGKPELEIGDGGGWWSVGPLVGDVPGHQHLTFTYAQPWPDHADPNKITIFNTPPNGTNVTRSMSFRNVMLVEGTETAEWAPAEGE